MEQRFPGTLGGPGHPAMSEACDASEVPSKAWADLSAQGALPSLADGQRDGERHSSTNTLSKHAAASEDNKVPRPLTVPAPKPRKGRSLGAREILSALVLAALTLLCPLLFYPGGSTWTPALQMVLGDVGACPAMTYVEYWTLLLGTIVAGASAVLLLRKARGGSTQIGVAATYALVNWAQGVFTQASNAGLFPTCPTKLLSWLVEGLTTQRYESTLRVMEGIGSARIALYVLGLVLVNQLALNKISAFEKSAGIQVGGWLMTCLVCCQAILASLALVFLIMKPFIYPSDWLVGAPFNFGNSWGGDEEWSIFFLTLLIPVFMLTTCVAVAGFARICWRLHRLLRHLRKVVSSGSTTALREAEKARRLALLQSGGIVACSILNVGVFCALSYMSAGGGFVPFLFQGFELLMSSAAAIILSGGHRTATVAPGPGCMPSRGAGCASFLCGGWRGSDTSCMEEDWREKVKELAGRSMSVRALLHFYRGLGQSYMEHFSPTSHTTHDVVRSAIIPLSRPTCTCLSDVLTAGQQRPPQKMVTHNWGNLFVDLVAAVLADALGEHSFGMISRVLMEDVSVLERMLEAKGAMDDTYWICAFCVNQHCSICGTNPDGAEDPVLMTPHAVCGCSLPKISNDTPPLTSDGRSIPCEMNKFDRMMSLLASETGLAQVIAVDADFSLFNRAWCIAELAAAHNMGMAQHMKVKSRTQLERKSEALRGLRVETMQAYRQKDVTEILAKIPDKVAFNSALQQLIFDRRSGLLARWHELDASQQLSQAGRLLLWQLGDDGQGLTWRCWDEPKGEQGAAVEP